MHDDEDPSRPKRDAKAAGFQGHAETRKAGHRNAPRSAKAIRLSSVRRPSP